MEDNKEKAPSDVEDHKEPDEAICSTLGNTEVLQTKSEIVIDSALEKFSKLHDNQICTKCGNANHRANALYCHKCGKKL